MCPGTCLVMSWKNPVESKRGRPVESRAQPTQHPPWRCLGNQHCGQTSTSSTSARPCCGGTSQEAGWSSSRWYPTACAGSGQEKIRLPRSFRGASARLPRILGPKRVHNNISKSQKALRVTGMTFHPAPSPHEG